MGAKLDKSIFIAEKPSVANEFAKALKLKTQKKDGYLESENTIITWCVGHLVTMSYPEAYDVGLKRWTFETLPFIPEEFKYEVIPSVKKQFKIVKELLNREDVKTIYVCTDSGREGEYIYRLVEKLAKVKDKVRKRVWIDSQTEEEIIKGIKTAKDLSEYDNLSEAAYLRAKEDYLMGINFSRVLTLKYGYSIKDYLKKDRAVISVGRVMTCVLGMIVRREREVREFVKTPFYRVLSNVIVEGEKIELEWKAVKESKYFESLLLYKENGFKEKETANELIKLIKENEKLEYLVENIEKKKEKKNPPLLYNLAELQNECSKMLKISPDETLKIVQDLYEKKMLTYPRTDARVLSSAVAKEITKNINGLKSIVKVNEFASEIIDKKMYQGIEKTKYVDDKQITDHYAIIPTGQGTNLINNLKPSEYKVYMSVVKRFLAIFFPPAIYQKTSILATIVTKEPSKESFFAGFKILIDKGYLRIYDKEENTEELSSNELAINALKKLKKNDKLNADDLFIKEGETSPPKRYNSGSIILAMENAGQLIEDEELRSQIKGSGIGTSATRAEILKKLVTIDYINLNKKTQIITPTQFGEMIYDVVNLSIRSLLNPELTASWEKGLDYVAKGTTTPEEYMEKLSSFVIKRVEGVKALNNQKYLYKCYLDISKNYK